MARPGEGAVQVQVKVKCKECNLFNRCGVRSGDNNRPLQFILQHSAGIHPLLPVCLHDQTASVDHV